MLLFWIKPIWFLSQLNLIVKFRTATLVNSENYSTILFPKQLENVKCLLCDNMILHLDWHELPLATNTRHHHLCNPDSLGVSAANNHLLSMKGKCTIATSQKRKTGTRKWQQAVWWFMQWGHPPLSSQAPDSPEPKHQHLWWWENDPWTQRP